MTATERTANNYPTQKSTSWQGKRRRSVLLDATEMFCKYVRPSSRQISQFKEQFYLLIGSSSYQDKRIIAASLSNNAFTPRTIAYYLAMELVQVAAPVLLISPVLKEIDLVNIIGKTTPEHVAIIARRKDLTEKLCEQICLYGNETAHLQLLKNPALKETVGLADSVRKLLKQLQSNAVEAQQLSASRNDAEHVEQPLPAKIASKIADQAVAASNENTVEKKPASPLQPAARARAAAVASAPSKQTQNDRARAELIALAARGGKLGKDETAKNAQTFAPAARPERQVNGIFTAAVDGIGAQMLQHARKRNVEQCAELVHRHCGIKVTTAMQLINEAGGESLCLLMKALAIPKGTASQILLLLNRESGRSVPAFKRLINRYETLEMKVCQDFLIRLGADFSSNGSASQTAHARRRNDDGDFSTAISSRRTAISSFSEKMRTANQPADKKSA